MVATCSFHSYFSYFFSSGIGLYPLWIHRVSDHCFHCLPQSLLPDSLYFTDCLEVFGKLEALCITLSNLPVAFIFHYSSITDDYLRSFHKKTKVFHSRSLFCEWSYRLVSNVNHILNFRSDFSFSIYLSVQTILSRVLWYCNIRLKKDLIKRNLSVIVVVGTS